VSLLQIPILNQRLPISTNSDSQSTASNILWGAAAAAAIGAFAAEAAKRKKERDARRARWEKKKKERAKLQAIWDENGAALYEEKVAEASQVTTMKILREKNLIAKEGLLELKNPPLPPNNPRTPPTAFMCTPSNPKGLPLPSLPALDWMIDFFRDDRMPGNTALERTQYLLDNTEGGRYTHFLDIPKGDSGFRLDYQDSTVWLGSSNQVGHYLTAVDISVRVHSFSGRIKPIAQKFGLAIVIGHEMLGDTVRIPFSGFEWTGHILQGLYGVRAQVLSLGKVNDWFLHGSDQDLQKILDYGPVDNWDYFHEGNSIQDLKLSREGWNAGEQLINGEFQVPEDFAEYLEEGLK